MNAITTADYLALPPQERWVIIEERVFERAILRNYITKEPTHRRAGKGCLYKGILEPLPNRDQPNGWWEIVEEMHRRGFSSECSIYNSPDPAAAAFFKDTEDYFAEEASIALAVQVAALRAVGFIEE